MILLKTFFLFLLLSISIKGYTNSDDIKINYREINKSLSNITIYYYDPNEMYKDRLITSLKVYDNKNLQGSPSFEISNEKIEDMRNNKKHDYYFKDYFNYNIKTFSSDIKDLPFDFITASVHGLYLSITNYQNGIATVQDQKKSYYLKLQENNFLSGTWPHSSVWPQVNDAKMVQKYLKNLERDDRNFFSLIDSIRKCVNEKDLKCLKNKLDASDSSRLDNNISEWSISKDKNLCEKMRPNHNSVTRELEAEIKERIVPWSEFQKILNFNDSSIEYELTKVGFGKNDSISLSLEGECACVTCINIDMTFIREADTIWKTRLTRTIGQ